MPDASVELGLNANGMYRDLATAEQRFTHGVNRMGDGARRAAGASDRLLESNNRVTNQAAGFARSLLNARSATDVLVSGLDRLENSMNLSLGAGVVVAGAAVLIQRVAEIRAEAKRLNEEFDKLSKPRGPAANQTLESIRSHTAELKTKIEELRKLQQGGFGQDVWDFFSVRSRTGGPSELVERARNDRRQKIGTYEEQLQQGGRDEAFKLRQQNAVERTRLGGDDVAARRQQLEHQWAEDWGSASLDGNLEKLNAAAEKFTIAMETLSKEVMTAQLDRTGMTLGELAAEGGPNEFIGSGMTNAQVEQRLRDRQAAREVLAWEAEEERLRSVGNRAGAAIAGSHADEIRKGIGGLNESEKDLKGQINASDLPPLLRKIEQNTAGRLVNR